MKVKIVDYSGGQASKNYADELTANQGALIENAIINVKGQLASRLGQSVFNADTNNTTIFNGIGRFDSESGGSVTSYMAVASDPSVVTSLSTDKTWKIINSGNNITAGYNAEFVQAGSLLFVMNGFDPMAWYSGSNWYKSGAYPTSPPTVTTGAWLGNYFFIAGNPTNPEYLYHSDINVPTSFQSVNVVNVSLGDGQPIEKVANYRTGDLIVYKTRSIFDLNIVSNGNTTCIPQPDCTWTLTPLTQDTGTLSPRSVVSLGNDQWFLSGPPFAVRSVIRSQFDKTFVNMVSQPIQDIFDGTNINGQTLNTGQVGKAAAVYFDNKYILAIPLSGSSVNNLVLVYDFITQSWYEITGWYPAEWLVYNYNLYYIDANDRRVVQCFTGATGDIGTVVPSTSAPTVGIDYLYVSKIFDFDNQENYKALDSIKLEFNPTGAYSATVSLNLDNTGWQTAGTILLQGAAITLPVNLPFTLASPGLTYGTLQLTKYGKFKKIQLKIELQGVSQQITLQKITLYATLLPYEREEN